MDLYISSLLLGATGLTAMALSGLGSHGHAGGSHGHGHAGHLHGGHGHAYRREARTRVLSSSVRPLISGADRYFSRRNGGTASTSPMLVKP